MIKATKKQEQNLLEAQCLNQWTVERSSADVP